MPGPLVNRGPQPPPMELPSRVRMPDTKLIITPIINFNELLIVEKVEINESLRQTWREYKHSHFGKWFGTARGS